MELIASTEALARVIQLAVAPVFLLAGIAGILGVLSTRLGRIIDRARVVEVPHGSLLPVATERERLERAEDPPDDQPVAGRANVVIVMPGAKDPAQEGEPDDDVEPFLDHLAIHRFAPESVPKSGRLSVVARFGVGYDTVDVAACTKGDIALCITPDGVRRAYMRLGRELAERGDRVERRVDGHHRRPVFDHRHA